MNDKCTIIFDCQLLHISIFNECFYYCMTLTIIINDMVDDMIWIAILSEHGCRDQLINPYSSGTFSWDDVHKKSKPFFQTTKCSVLPCKTGCRVEFVLTSAANITQLYSEDNQNTWVSKHQS